MEIQRGDIGTKYQVPIVDEAIDPETFDPSSAVQKKLYFSMPGNESALARDAEVEQIDVDGEPMWALTYTVAPSDALTFHVAAGRVKLQAEITYADGRNWRSVKVATDIRGRPILVVNTL